VTPSGLCRSLSLSTYSPQLVLVPGMMVLAEANGMVAPFSNRSRKKAPRLRAGRRPGPRGPSKELIATVLEIKRRNPRFGCPRIAQQISHAFGLEIDKDVVRRILANHPLPKSGGKGPSWLSIMAESRDSLWSVDLFRCESILLKSFWGDARHGCLHAPDRRIRC